MPSAARLSAMRVAGFFPLPGAFGAGHSSRRKKARSPASSALLQPDGCGAVRPWPDIAVEAATSAAFQQREQEP